MSALETNHSRPEPKTGPVLAEGKTRSAIPSTDVDPDQERAYCYDATANWCDGRTHTPITEILIRERETARAHAVLAAHKAYRELSTAVGDFLHSPDSLQRLARAYNRTRDL